MCVGADRTRWHVMDLATFVSRSHIRVSTSSGWGTLTGIMHQHAIACHSINVVSVDFDVEDVGGAGEVSDGDHGLRAGMGVDEFSGEQGGQGNPVGGGDGPDRVSGGAGQCGATIQREFHQVADLMSHKASRHHAAMTVRNRRTRFNQRNPSFAIDV